MKEELDNQLEYRTGDKHGIVDFGTVEVIRDIHSTIPASFETHEILFSEEDFHAGIIASLISEMLPAFNVGDTPSIRVNGTTRQVLDAMGLSYREVTTPKENIVHAEEKFALPDQDLRLSGD